MLIGDIIRIEAINPLEFLTSKSLVFDNLNNSFPFSILPLYVGSIASNDSSFWYCSLFLPMKEASFHCLQQSLGYIVLSISKDSSYGKHACKALYSIIVF